MRSASAVRFSRMQAARGAAVLSDYGLCSSLLSYSHHAICGQPLRDLTDWCNPI